jgi:hypothetical protein
MDLQRIRWLLVTWCNMLPKYTATRLTNAQRQCCGLTAGSGTSGLEAVQRLPFRSWSGSPSLTPTQIRGKRRNRLLICETMATLPQQTIRTLETWNCEIHHNTNVLDSQTDQRTSPWLLTWKVIRPHDRPHMFSLWAGVANAFLSILSHFEGRSFLRCPNNLLFCAHLSCTYSLLFLGACVDQDAYKQPKINLQNQSRIKTPNRNNGVFFLTVFSQWTNGSGGISVFWCHPGYGPPSFQHPHASLWERTQTSWHTVAPPNMIMGVAPNISKLYYRRPSS